MQWLTTEHAEIAGCFMAFVAAGSVVSAVNVVGTSETMRAPRAFNEAPCHR